MRPEEKREGDTLNAIKLSPAGRKTFRYVLAVLVAIVCLAFLYQAGYVPGMDLDQEEARDPVAMGLTILSIVITLWLIYLIPAKSFDAQTKRRPERAGDLILIKGLVRAFMRRKDPHVNRDV
jgi:TRAP-type C4-dicarboxylate transport system permease small subunit